MCCNKEREHLSLKSLLTVAVPFFWNENKSLSNVLFGKKWMIKYLIKQKLFNSPIVIVAQWFHGFERSRVILSQGLVLVQDLFNIWKICLHKPKKEQLINTLFWNYDLTNLVAKIFPRVLWFIKKVKGFIEVWHFENQRISS